MWDTHPCVIYWQAKEISRVLKMGIPEGEDINISLREHVSPIEWENVILYGQYVLNWKAFAKIEP